jgi:hypothetical protein
MFAQRAPLMQIQQRQVSDRTVDIAAALQLLGMH